MENSVFLIQRFIPLLIPDFFPGIQSPGIAPDLDLAKGGAPGILQRDPGGNGISGTHIPNAFQWKKLDREPLALLLNFF